MKKILHMILFVLMCSLMLNTEFSTANASNWLKITDNDHNTIYLDAESFKFDEEQAIFSCWERMIDKKDNSEFKSYVFYNLKDRTSATKMFVHYLPDGTSNSQNYSYLDYVPVIPDSVGEHTLKVCEFMAIIPKTGVEWNFLNTVVPQHSKWDSDNWVKDENFLAINGKVVTYDKTTYAYDEKSNIESFWGKEPGQLNGKECESYTYYLHNKTTGKYAVVSIENIIDGVSYNRIDLPVTIWHDEKSLYPGAEEKELSVGLLIYQASLVA